MDETYEENEKVLVHHQNRIYEAKVIKIDPKNKVDSKKRPLYFIHYLGWKEKWNEWVESSSILKFTEKNKELQRKVNNKASSTTDNASGEDDQTSHDNENNDDDDDQSPRSNSSNSSRASSSSSKNKRKRNESRYVQNANNKYMEIEIPSSLKGKLVDDWNFVNNEKSIIQLPKDPSIGDILLSVIEESDNKTAEYKETINGIRQYFNKALGTLLLYKFERPQYDQMLKSNPNKSMSEIYGAEHLLRLFVKLPSLLVISNLEEKTVSQLKEVFDQVLQYLDKNSSTLFTKEYTVATTQYLKAASV
ncbi:hypothetical protein DICPUDRAFT_59449 [Dictyostelium purpureum]|uniref:Chromo domain-containing protein n=1 Tax=Dictyostelium purpureum TaxID=5786 RepID=F1A652_DICPU|nr:uncharacterized protein DICPUDRAFT_59449 [Dictyostelium purpureum]EGC28328.1 hypothetical protein DICPUDRAFT_59449 [Dictyostelium purpureum]|eukprot:XP_003295146.1 hypothetical protein DICPUDRAFT_59449 [Dictyostelium purpureum]